MFNAITKFLTSIMESRYERMHAGFLGFSPIYISLSTVSALDVVNKNLKASVRAAISSSSPDMVATYVQVRPVPEFFKFPLPLVAKLDAVKELISYAQQNGFAVHIIGNIYDANARVRRKETGRWEYHNELRLELKKADAFALTAQDFPHSPVYALSTD